MHRRAIPKVILIKHLWHEYVSVNNEISFPATLLVKTGVLFFSLILSSFSRLHSSWWCWSSSSASYRRLPKTRTRTRTRAKFDDHHIWYTSCAMFFNKWDIWVKITYFHVIFQWELKNQIPFRRKFPQTETDIPAEDQPKRPRLGVTDHQSSLPETTFQLLPGHFLRNPSRTIDFCQNNNKANQMLQQ